MIQAVGQAEFRVPQRWGGRFPVVHVGNDSGLRRNGERRRPPRGQALEFAMRTSSMAISSGERMKSMQPLAMALSGMSGCFAVSGR